MRSFFFVLLFFSCSVVSGEPLVLTSADWARPRSGEMLMQQPVLEQVRQAFEREPGGVIVIGHATNEAGQLWAEELRAWLVALGVSSARIRLAARPEMEDVLTLDVHKQADL